MRTYVIFAFLTVLVVAQSTLTPFAALGNAKPVLPLLAVVAWGLLRGPLAAAWWAVVTGLLMDFLSPAPFGLYTVPMLVAAGLTAASRRRVSASHLLLPGMVAAMATAGFVVSQRLLVALSVRAYSIAPPPLWTWRSVGEDLVPLVALNLLWLPVVYFPLRAVSLRTSPPRMDWER